jgi:F-type H+-transporting ATPase subunit gamma
MATIRQINRRIKSVRNTSKVTKAMEMIAASKMKRAQERTLASRPYAEKIKQVPCGADTRGGGESSSSG